MKTSWKFRNSGEEEEIEDRASWVGLWEKGETENAEGENEQEED